MTRRLLIVLEFILLFFGIPLWIYLDREFIHPSVLLLPILLFVILILKYRTEFKLGELTYLPKKRRIWIGSFSIVLLTAIILVGGTLIFVPEDLFNLPRKNPMIFLAMCLFYPVFSAYPQEIIYRSFLFHRYRVLFNGNLFFILGSSISFAFMHIVFYSPVSMILTFAMGVYLAYLYIKTGSVLFTSILHGLFGILVFAIGLGKYFWLDMPV